MRISCPSCQSSYKIADEKVQGRTVKVRCRKCGLMIHVNEHGVANDAGGGAAQPAQPSPAAASTSSPQFSVLVAEGDQRDMSLADVVSAYNSGFVTADTFVWAEGQPDWMPLAQIPEIVEALNAASAAVDAQATDEFPETAAPAQAPAPEPAPEPSPAPAPMDFSAPAPVESPPASFEQPAPSPSPGGMFGAAAAPAPEPNALFGATPGAAVREDRRAGSVDLFSKQARAGADEEIATSAPAMAPDPVHKPLGARDESSVLFSLSALTAAQGSSPSSLMSGGKKDDSGLIDLRALADKDDAVAAAPMMAMPGAILDSAPLLGTPIVDPNLHQLQASEPPPSKSNKGMIIGIAFGVGGMLIAVVVAVIALTREPEQPVPVATTPVDPTETVAVAAPTAPPTDTGSAAAAPPTGAPSATAAATTKPTYGGGKPRGPATAKTADPGKPPSTGEPASTGKPPPKKSPCGCAPGDLACNMACAVK